jgi:DNA-binding response OmpR family regulator
VDNDKPTLLIVEDDLDIADMLNAYFRVQGYEVLTVNWGEDGVRACQNNAPDLVILDIRLPDVDGFEVARTLRSSRKTKNIPIIFLTEKRERGDRLRGLELQADDYITKPFDVQELRLRVRNALQRAKQGTLTHPVTGLPEGTMVDEALAKGLAQPQSVYLVVSIKNLNLFRDVYGFVASDDLLRAVSLMLKDVVREASADDDFVGHLSAADFLVLPSAGDVASLKERIKKRLEQSFSYFYSNQDREQGTFRNKALSVDINEFLTTSAQRLDLANLKAELERYCFSS